MENGFEKGALAKSFAEVATRRLRSMEIMEVLRGEIESLSADLEEKGANFSYETLFEDDAGEEQGDPVEQKDRWMVMRIRRKEGDETTYLATVQISPTSTMEMSILGSLRFQSPDLESTSVNDLARALGYFLAESSNLQDLQAAYETKKTPGSIPAPEPQA